MQTQLICNYLITENIDIGRLDCEMQLCHEAMEDRLFGNVSYTIQQHPLHVIIAQTTLLYSNYSWKCHKHLCVCSHNPNPAKIRSCSHSKSSALKSCYPQETLASFLLTSKPHSLFTKYSIRFKTLCCITQTFQALVMKTQICLMPDLLQWRCTVWVESLHVFLQRSAVAELLLTNVTHECLHASVLHKMSLQIVRGCKPTSTVLTVIGVVPLVNG